MASSRVPPHNVEAEQAVIGCMLLDTRAAAYAAAALTADDFYLHRHETIFRAVCRLLREDTPTDPVTVGEHLESQGVLLDVGGAMTLCELMESVPHTVHVRHYCKLVRRYGDRRRVLTACRQGVEDVYSGRPISEIVDAVTRAGGSSASVGARTLGEIRAAIQESPDVAIQPTGFTDLDAALGGGFRAGQLIVVAARPSMGKTAIGVQMAAQAARDVAGLLVSIEMRAEEVVGRLHEADVPEDRLLIEDSVSELGEVCAAVRRTYQQHMVSLAVVDYLQRVRVPGSGKTHEKLERVTSEAKRLARDLDIPIVLLAQLSRRVEERDNKRPRLTDLKGAGAIEEDADQVLLLYRPEYYDPTDRPGEADLIVAKNRSGERNQTVKLGFIKEETRFVPHSERPIPLDDYFQDT